MLMLHIRQSIYIIFICYISPFFKKRYIVKRQKLVRVVIQVNAMQIIYKKTIYKLTQCKIKTRKKKRILKTILTDFSRKEKALTRYTRIYI